MFTEAPLYVIFTVLLPSPFSSAQIFSSTPHSYFQQQKAATACNLQDAVINGEQPL
jgi:hypothetical protein